MIWNREQYIAHMHFQDTGRELFCELFGPLKQLEREWRAQGASDAEIDLSAFGFDGVDYHRLDCKTGAVTSIEPVVLSDSPEETLLRDNYGRMCKLFKNSATIALPLEYPVRTMDDWLAIKHWYAFSENRVDMDALRMAKQRQDAGALILAGMPGGFDEPRQLMGEEELCVAFYEQPELIEDMLETMADTALKVFERVCEVVTVDNLCVHEDMAGKSGPLAGPKQIRKFIAPYYRKIWDELSNHGTVLFSQDSDGDMRPVIDAFLDAGVTIMYPFEPGSGMDMVQSRAQYGERLGIKGGIDKYALRGTKEDIRHELEYKLGPSMRSGGVAFGLDHRIPNGVSLEHYRYYVALCREMLGLEPHGVADHIRMAF